MSRKNKKKKNKTFIERVVNFFRYHVWGGYMNGGILGIYHWIRCHYWNRYHVINISGEDDYSWGWLDRDHVLLLASFKILRDFVEKEDPGIGLRTAKDYNSDGNVDECLKLQLEREQEIRALYNWWTIDRPRARNALADKIVKGDRETLLAYYEKEEALDEIDTEMLMRLVKIRGSLWT